MTKTSVNKLSCWCCLCKAASESFWPMRSNMRKQSCAECLKMKIRKLCCYQGCSKLVFPRNCCSSWFSKSFRSRFSMEPLTQILCQSPLRLYHPKRVTMLLFESLSKWDDNPKVGFTWNNKMSRWWRQWCKGKVGGEVLLKSKKFVDFYFKVKIDVFMFASHLDYSVGKWFSKILIFRDLALVHRRRHHTNFHIVSASSRSLILQIFDFPTLSEAASICCRFQKFCCVGSTAEKDWKCRRSLVWRFKQDYLISGELRSL